MIFILHYILLNVGLPAIIILITLFLHTHSDASLSEIGALLMALPFVSIVTKPLFCALADRHRAHKQYLMASLGFMALGYGSLTIAPFFPDFVKEHGRLVWYLDIVGIIVGFGAFGIVWSLGDALAVNGAQMAGVSWGSYRLWAVISWGVCGAIIGQLNELPFLPAYVAGLLLLAVSLVVEIVLLAVWPNERFIMCAHLNKQTEQAVGKGQDTMANLPNQHQQQVAADWQPAAGLSRSGTLTSSMGGTLGSQPRALGAIANIFMEDVGDTLKSTLKLGGGRSGKARKGLEEILGGDLIRTGSQLARTKSSGAQSVHSHKSHSKSDSTLWLAQCQLPACKDPKSEIEQQQQQQQQVATVETINTCSSERKPPEEPISLTKLEEQPIAPRSSEDIQLFMLRLIVRRDKTIFKYLVLFTLFGLLMMCHISYFYMHVRRLCSQRGDNFALISGAMMLAHAVSEVLSFLLVPRYIPWSGRVGALMTCAALYFVRFAYYGLWLTQLPTHYGIPFEFCHGLAYGIVYSLICDIAVECVDQVDEFLPELIEKGLARADIRPSELKSPLRATMQGVFSGAFDGLGNGLGALFGGVFLDAYSFEKLWQVCACVCLAIMVIYPLVEWRALTSRRERDKLVERAKPPKQIATNDQGQTK